MHSTLKRILATAVGLTLVGLLPAGCGKSNPGGAPPPMGPPEVGIVTIQPRRATVSTELPGRTSAVLVAEVRPQVGGIIQERLFTEGSDVKAGDILYRIDPATYKAAHDSAKAALARAEASLVPIRLKEERYRDLLARQLVSQQDYDDASAKLVQAQADVDVAKASLESARINLAYCNVTAPISGRIGRSAVTTGALVKASQDNFLAVIQKLDSVYVDVTQSSAELLRLKQTLGSGRLKRDAATQAKVKLFFEDGSAYPHEGALKFTDVTVDPGTGSVTLRCLFPNPEKLLLPGMFVRVVVEEGVNEEAILVPQRGVTRNQAGQPMVMVVGAEEKVEPRVIKADRTVGDSWLVSEGLKAGDRVILEGIQRARPGTPVKAVPFGSKTEAAAGSAPGGAQQPPAAEKK